MNIKFFVVFLMALLYSHNAEAVRCYSCISKGNDDCLDPEKFKMGKKICDLQALQDTQRFANLLDKKFTEVFQVDVFQEDNSVVPQQCFKQVTRIHGEDIVLRGCQVSPTDKMDICKKINEVGKPPINVTHCSLCDNDGCNSSNKLYIYSFTTLTFALTLLLININ